MSRNSISQDWLPMRLLKIIQYIEVQNDKYSIIHPCVVSTLRIIQNMPVGAWYGTQYGTQFAVIVL